MTVEHSRNKGDLELMGAVAESWVLGSREQFMLFSKLQGAL